VLQWNVHLTMTWTRWWTLLNSSGERQQSPSVTRPYFTAASTPSSSSWEQAV